MCKFLVALLVLVSVFSTRQVHAYGERNDSIPQVKTWTLVRDDSKIHAERIQRENSTKAHLRLAYKEAVVKKDVQALRKLVAQGLDLNEPFNADLSTHETNASVLIEYPPILYYLASGYFGRDHHQRAVNAFSNDFLIEMILLGADIHARPVIYNGTKEGLTPLIMAVDAGNYEAVQTLLAFDTAGACLSEVDDFNKTALHFAGDAQIANLLIAAGANVNALDKLNRTPLMLASEAHLADVVKILLTYMTIDDINQCEAFSNESALHLAVGTGHFGAWSRQDMTEWKYLETIQLLLDAGADANSRTAIGKTPYDVAVDELRIERELYYGRYADAIERAMALLLSAQ